MRRLPPFSTSTAFVAGAVTAGLGFVLTDVIDLSPTWLAAVVAASTAVAVMLLALWLQERLHTKRARR
jgi:membrane protein implicated in regulation of membrane protease activity